MAVTFTAERAELVSTTNGSTYSITGFTPTAGSLLVALIILTDTAATFSVQSLDGTGLTWTDSGVNVLRDNGTTFFDAELWTATTTGAATGTITLTATEAVTSAVVWIGEFAGANLGAPIKQTNKSEAGTTDPNISLGVAPDSDSLCVAMYGAFADLNQAAEAGWNSQLAVDTQANPTQGFGVWVSTAADQTFTASGTDGNHFSFIAEIDAATDTSHTHTVLTTTPTLPQASLAMAITHVVLAVTPEQPQASITVAQSVTHVVLVVSASQPAAEILVDQDVTHVVLAASPSQPAAQLDLTLTALVLATTPEQPPAVVLGALEVEHVVLEVTPTLAAGMLIVGEMGRWVFGPKVLARTGANRAEER